MRILILNDDLSIAEMSYYKRDAELNVPLKKIKNLFASKGDKEYICRVYEQKKTDTIKMFYFEEIAANKNVLFMKNTKGVRENITIANEFYLMVGGMILILGICSAAYFAKKITKPEKIIMISPRLRSDAAYLSELKIPSGHNGYLMAEWHFYVAGPSKTNPRKLWTTGTDAEKKLITDKIQLALEWQQKNQIPTWIGAWMAGDYNDGNHYSVEEQIIFASFMKQQLTQAGIPFAVNSDTKFYDREKNTWVEAMQPLFECIYGKKAIASKPEGNNTSSTTNIKINKKIHVGFNAKGNLDTANRYKYVRSQFAALKKKKADTGKIYIKLQAANLKNWLPAFNPLLYFPLICSSNFWINSSKSH